MTHFGREVYVVGVGMHPFNNRDTKMRDLAFVSAAAALKDAGLRFFDIDAVYTGYLTGQVMDALSYAKDLGLSGAPITHVENASATGSAAFREAVLSVAGGASEVAMAWGFDDLNNLTGVGVARQDMEGVILPAAFFALWGVRRMHDRGTTIETFAKIAAKNWNQARDNVNAQRQAKHEVTVEEVLASKPIAHPFTSKMAAATGGGGACAIVATKEVAKRISDQTGHPMVRVAAAAMETEQYTEGHIFLGATVGPGEMTRTTARQAYEQWGHGPRDLSMVQVHDAFPIEELLYYELLDICRDGEGDALVHDGVTALGGRIPFSTDGGLIARGHPGGPTGLAQVHETVLQLRGQAGSRQVANARSGLVQMMGGGSVCVIHILERV